MTQASPSSDAFYFLYGVSVRSHWPLPYPKSAAGGTPDVELAEASEGRLEQARIAAAPLNVQEWFEHRNLPGGITYLRWLGLYDFLVSADGRRIETSLPAGVSKESFLVYLLNGALPVALLKLGYDPLHATVAAVDGRAVGFLGKSGYGKSTLGGAFLQAGYPILTDDLVVLKSEMGCWQAYPGPPRIKLFPEAASAVMASGMQGVPMNPQSIKLIFPLSGEQSLQTALPLGALYLLNRPRADSSATGRIRILRLSARRALLALVKNSYNDWLSEPARLSLQLMQYSQIASQVPVKFISYPRRLDALASVCDAILADLRIEVSAT